MTCQDSMQKIGFLKDKYQLTTVSICYLDCGYQRTTNGYLQLEFTSLSSKFKQFDK